MFTSTFLPKRKTGIQCFLIALLALSTAALQAKSTNWTGTVSSSWNDPGNWSNGIPASDDDICIGCETYTNAPILNIFFTISGNGTLTIHDGSSLQNDGELYNYGTLDNSGTIINFNFISNYGTLTITSTGTLNNYSILDNDGTLKNDGTLNINSGALTNFASIENNGTLGNNSIIANASGGTLDNYGTLNNNNQISNYGTIYSCEGDYNGNNPIGNPLESCLLNICEAVGNGVTYINGLNLTSGQANSLIEKLVDAQERYCEDDPVQALNKLNAFLNQVASLQGEGVLSVAAAAYLADLGQEIIEAIISGDVECCSGQNLIAPGNNGNSTFQAANQIELEAYPNPTAGNLTVSTFVPESGLFTISVSDLTGKQLYHYQGNAEAGHFDHRIDLTNYTAGAYLLTFRQNDTVVHQKLIKH